MLDAGLTGQDWIAEHEAGDGKTGVLTSVADPLHRSRARQGEVVLAAPEDSPFKPRRTEGKTIATELVCATRVYFERQ